MDNLNDMIKRAAQNGYGAPVLLLMMLAMVVLPLPAFILDILFTFSLSFSIIVLLATIYTERPLEFAAFPTVLLLATLVRLALNIASTRVVLLNGHTGTDAAGKVIESFGDFVIGGNYAVGIVIFSILVIINFVVVTKGAGRVSEVTARFTLDAMPGKQMAIDADLNAGLIDSEEALRRREEVVQESDFYGAMDGASKFVRGDAIAGILILIINIIGGIAIGLLQHEMAFNNAMQNYTLLTVGDGLVAQIPSLLLSTSAAIMVTRVSKSQKMGEQIVKQMFQNETGLIVTAAIMMLLGLIPGMPHLPFIMIASLCVVVAFYIKENKKRHTQEQAEPVSAPVMEEQRELSWDDVEPVDVVGLEVGYRLIPLVDKDQGGTLMARIKGIRKKLTQELGFLIPTVHIRDNLDLGPTLYRIILKGVVRGEHLVHPEMDLAINPGNVLGRLSGIEDHDPAFALPAVWIEKSQREHAQTLGYTVVDCATVIATHLSQILKDNANELLGLEEVQQLLDSVKRSHPQIVENLVADVLPVSIILRVLQNLLAEQIPIRDMRSIAETLAEFGAKSQDPDMLTAQVRMTLRRSIVQQINGNSNEIQVIALDPHLEQLLQQSNQAETGVVIEPLLAEKLQGSLLDAGQKQEALGRPAILIVPANLRSWMAKFVRHLVPSLRVLSYNEIPDDATVKIVSSIGQ